MKEKERILSLFQKLYEGEPWIDINTKSTLSKISAARASARVLEKCNTIWEIVNHIINWRMVVLQRIKEIHVVTPDNNFFEPVIDTSESAWKNTLERLKDSQQQWITFLKTFKESDFEKLYQNKYMSYYEHIQGIIQHDAYHLGQITLLSKII